LFHLKEKGKKLKNKRNVFKDVWVWKRARLLWGRFQRLVGEGKKEGSFIYSSMQES
jgi:hypothetical protein